MFSLFSLVTSMLSLALAPRFGLTFVLVSVDISEHCKKKSHSFTYLWLCPVLLYTPLYIIRHNTSYVTVWPFNPILAVLYVYFSPCANVKKIKNKFKPVQQMYGSLLSGLVLSCFSNDTTISNVILGSLSCYSQFLLRFVSWSWRFFLSASSMLCSLGI